MLSFSSHAAEVAQFSGSPDLLKLSLLMRQVERYRCADIISMAFADTPKTEHASVIQDCEFSDKHIALRPGQGPIRA